MFHLRGSVHLPMRAASIIPTQAASRPRQANPRKEIPRNLDPGHAATYVHNCSPTENWAQLNKIPNVTYRARCLIGAVSSAYAVLRRRAAAIARDLR